MKFVALALALLLAVGSRAASLQADAPSQLQHMRAAADIYLTQVKEGAKNALRGLDGTEYNELKVRLIQRLDEMHEQMKTLQGSVSPLTDSAVTTLVESTSELRANLLNDFETMKADLEPKYAKLKEVLENHFQDYRNQIKPIVKEYMERHTAEMESLKVKMEPVVENLRAKVSTNVEETKAALMPIVESVRTKLSERLESLKEMAAPYVQEYKEQLAQAYANAQTIDNARVETLRARIVPLAEDIKIKLQAMSDAFLDSISQS